MTSKLPLRQKKKYTNDESFFSFQLKYPKQALKRTKDIILSRVAAFIIDSFIVTFLIFMANIFALLIGIFSFMTLWNIAFSFTTFFVIYPAYIAIITMKNGATWGQRIMGLTVETWNKKPLSWPHCLLRGILSYVSLTVLLGLPLLWALVDDEKRGLHDILSGTVVLKRFAFPPFH